MEGSIELSSVQQGAMSVLAFCSVVSRDGGPSSPAKPPALQQCTQSRSVWRSMPQFSADALRSLPSSTKAIASIGRAALASRAFADAPRNSFAAKSLRVIPIAAIVAWPTAVSQSFADSGILSPSQKLGRLV